MAESGPDWVGVFHGFVAGLEADVSASPSPSRAHEAPSGIYGELSLAGISRNTIVRSATSAIPEPVLAQKVHRLLAYAKHAAENPEDAVAFLDALDNRGCTACSHCPHCNTSPRSSTYESQASSDADSMTSSPLLAASLSPGSGAGGDAGAGARAPPHPHGQAGRRQRANSGRPRPRLVCPGCIKLRPARNMSRRAGSAERLCKTCIKLVERTLKRGVTPDNAKHAQLERLYGYLSKTHLAARLGALIGVRTDEPPAQPWSLFVLQNVHTSDGDLLVEGSRLPKRPRTKAILTKAVGRKSQPPPVLAVQVAGSSPGKVVPLFEPDGDRCRTTCLPKGKYVLRLHVTDGGKACEWLVGVHTSEVRRAGVRVEQDGRAPPLKLLPEVPRAQDEDSKREAPRSNVPAILRGHVHYIPPDSIATRGFGPLDVADNSTIAVVVVAGRRTSLRDVDTMDDIHEKARQYWIHGLPGEAATDDESDVEVARRLGELTL